MRLLVQHIPEHSHGYWDPSCSRRTSRRQSRRGTNSARASRTFFFFLPAFFLFHFHTSFAFSTEKEDNSAWLHARDYLGVNEAPRSNGKIGGHELCSSSENIAISSFLKSNYYFFPPRWTHYLFVGLPYFNSFDSSFIITVLIRACPLLGQLSWAFTFSSLCMYAHVSVALPESAKLQTVGIYVRVFLCKDDPAYVYTSVGGTCTCTCVA